MQKVFYFVNSLTSNSSLRRRAFKRQCTEDGRWLEGSCEPVTCPPPPPVFHSMYQCTDGFRFDSTCWLQCHGANHTVRPPPPCKQVRLFTFLLPCLPFEPCVNCQSTSDTTSLPFYSYSIWNIIVFIALLS